MTAIASPQITTADILRRDGIAQVGRLTEWVDVVRHLQSRRVYPGHVKAKGDGKPTTVRAQRNSSYDMADVLAAPHFFKAALELTDIAADYLETTMPRMYSLNAFWATRRDGIHFGTQAWHRDPDDTRFLALFMYGTDIWDEADGPHQYQMGTQSGAEEGPVSTVYGPPGTLFLADTRGIHRGLPPQRDPRLLLWARWGVSETPRSYIVDKLKPAPKDRVPDYPADEFLRETIKLVVQ